MPSEAEMTGRWAVLSLWQSPAPFTQGVRPRRFKGEGARTTNLGMAGDWGGAGGDRDPS